MHSFSFISKCDVSYFQYFDKLISNLPFYANYFNKIANLQFVEDSCIARKISLQLV